MLIAFSLLAASAQLSIPADTSDLIDFVTIPAGSFTQGSPGDERGRSIIEGPTREVTIDTAFMLGRTEVSREQFAKFVGATGYVTEAERDAAGGFGIDFETGHVEQMTGISWRDPGFPGDTPDPRDPVVLITWNDAEAFCVWLSGETGLECRLPTEAEWEYAARAGTSTSYWFGDDETKLARFANVADRSLKNAMPAIRRSAAWSDGHAWVAPVASYPANPFGLHDMHGNVWEWCQDTHHDDAYFAGDATNPIATPVSAESRAPGDAGFRVIRGGGWLNPPHQNRSAQRVYFEPTFRYCLLSGFRVAADLPSPVDLAGHPETVRD